MRSAPTRSGIRQAAGILFGLCVITGGSGAEVPTGFVGCSTSDDCHPFHLDTHQVGAAIDLLPEGDYPYDATIRPDGQEVWFVGAVGDGAVVVDRETGTITHRIATGAYPTSIAFSGDGSLALVSCRDTEEVTVIDAQAYQVVSSLPLPAGIDGGNLALDPVSGNFYLVDWYDDTLFEIAPDGSAILRQTDVGRNLWQLVVDPDGSTIYVTDRGTDEVLFIDRETLTEITRAAVGDDPWGIDITGDGARLVVVCEDSHDVHLIDTETLQTTILPLAPDADPRDVDIRDDRGKAYVCGGRLADGSDPIYVIDLATSSVEAWFEANGTNPNVIAVQAQMHGTGAGVAQAGEGALRARLAVFPHPVTGGGSILSYELPEAGVVELTIHDAAGRRVGVLDRGDRSAGSHRIEWPLPGRALAGGIYFARLRYAGETTTLRLVACR